MLNDDSPAQSRISNYERGTRTPTYSDLAVLERALELKRGELLDAVQGRHEVRESPAPYQVEEPTAYPSTAKEEEKYSDHYSPGDKIRVSLHMPAWLFKLLKQSAEQAEVNIAAEVLLRLQRSFDYPPETEEFTRLVKAAQNAALNLSPDNGTEALLELLDLVGDIAERLGESVDADLQEKRNALAHSTK